jgi:hypothetical protein
VSIDVDELDDEHEQRHDFRRANGAPLVSDPENPEKTLRYRRPSGYAKVLDDENALVNWRIFKAMDGVARSKALQTQVVACRDDDREEKKRLREHALDKGQANERADQGTGLHAMTVRAEDPGDTEFDPGPHRADLDAYLECLQTYGLVSEMVEVPFVNDEWRAAGTADRLWRSELPLVSPDDRVWEPGELFLGDLKTGAKLDFGVPAYCVQTALYATGQLYDVVSERRLPTPPINDQWTLLLHLPVGKAKATLYWCSVTVGLYGAWMAFEVKQWQNKWKRGEHDIHEVPAPVTLERSVTMVLNEELGATVVMTDEIVPAMLAFCRKRIATIGEHDVARDKLPKAWPADLPKPSKITSPHDVVRLLDLLDAFEQEYSIPFLHADPRAELQMGVHKGAVDRSNGFALTNQGTKD